LKQGGSHHLGFAHPRRRLSVAARKPRNCASRLKLPLPKGKAKEVMDRQSDRRPKNHNGYLGRLALFDDPQLLSRRPSPPPLRPRQYRHRHRLLID
jgi:hypothetical protein